MRYRRADTPGATYFFTLNAADRSGQLLTNHIDALRDSFRTVRKSRPFVMDAICVLPDHLHVLMTLPREDADFATRIMLVKQGFSRRVPQGERISASRASKGERGLWQRRYWEHLIRDDVDFERHGDYIHFNPVKQGWAERAADWPHSSIHRFIRGGVIDAGWASVGGTETHAGE
ncbi:putative transposase [Pelomonas aquatica]|uniref:Transposase n=1 Tax=Pelomonas aquatica TaxID=431058 RepID=A0ABU1Z5N2_9BURK|nr:transposase [Pelomonas aquatica]MDR7295925.1 putative transposase [Pelomonas aquatica]